jgi:DNA-binding CsgD family transcriptional regulator
MDKIKKLYADPFPGLDKIEKETVRLYIKGYTPEDIAAELGLHVQSIYHRLQRLREKLGFETNNEIRRRWFEMFEEVLNL